MNTKQTGDITESICQTEMLKQGYRVSITFGDNCPYDLVLDDGKALKKIQCKTGWIDKDCIRFNVRSKTTKNGKTVIRKYETSEVDEFWVYCQDTDKVYKIANKDLPSDCVFLKLSKPKNGQTKGIRMASDYEV